MKFKTPLLALLISTTAINTAYAKFANGYYERKLMDKDIAVMNGEGPTPIAEF